MGKLSSYSGLTTKCRAMRGKLLKPDEYRQISEMADVTEVIEYLKHRPSYAKLLNNLDSSQLHRGTIEGILNGSIYEDYSKLYHFSSMNQRKYLDVYFMSYEVKVIKTCLRMVFDGNRAVLDLQEYEGYFQKHSHLNVQAMSRAATQEELLEVLKDSVYYKPLQPLLSVTHANLFDYENALDMFLFSNTWREYQKVMKAKEREAVLQAYGSEIDLLNLQWIYRAKKHYQMNAGELFGCLIPIKYKLKVEELHSMAQAENVEEFMKLVEQSYYATRLPELTSLQLEKSCRRLLDKIREGNMRKNPYSIACLDTYLYQKEREIDKLTTVIEGVRYGLAPDVIAGYIE